MIIEPPNSVEVLRFIPFFIIPEWAALVFTSQHYCLELKLLVVEIKNPLSIADEIPSAHNLSYLCMCNGKVALKQQHQYFAQVQGEMAITKRPLCYFFVYTRKGYHLETIRFNATYWCRLEENLTWFYNNCLSPAITSQVVSWVVKKYLENGSDLEFYKQVIIFPLEPVQYNWTTTCIILKWLLYFTLEIKKCQK